MASIAVCREREREGESERLTPDDPQRFPWHFPRPFPDLPLSDVLHPQAEGPLQAGAELQSIAADLDDVVDKGAHGRQGERRREKHHIAELYKHFLVVLKRTLRTSISGDGGFICV